MNLKRGDRTATCVICCRCGGTGFREMSLPGTCGKNTTRCGRCNGHGCVVTNDKGVYFCITHPPKRTS